MTTDAMKLRQLLWDEFGRAAVGKMRRELTIKNGKPPGNIELFAALTFQAGPQHGRPAMDTRKREEVEQ